MQKIDKNQSGFSLLLVIAIVVVVGVLIFVGFRVFNKNEAQSANAKTTEIKEQNKTNASALNEDKSQASLVIDEETAQDISNTNESQASDVESVSQPTIDAYGPSTKLDRPNVHGVTLGLYDIYSKYLFALQSVDEGQRQATSNQYLSDKKSQLSSEYFEANASSVNNLSLLLQSASVKLPASLRIGSAIVDPEDPTKVIAQVLMEPDVPWSILVSVKMKDSLGNFGTIEKVYIRQNQNPL